VGLAPRHERIATEAAVGAERDRHGGPHRAELRHDARHFLKRAGTRIAIRRPQPRAEQMLARKDVERQITIVAAVAVKEAPFLHAMDRIIRRIEIEDDLGRWRGVRLDEHVDE